MYASKPYYHNCDNYLDEMPIIKRAPKNHSEPAESDDVDLFYESWVDVEPFSGVVLRAAQKILMSAHLETDDLFEIDNKFVPIYNVFRTGNFTDDSANSTFSDLYLGLTLKVWMKISGFAITIFCVCLILYNIAKNRKRDVNEENEESRRNFI